MREYEIGTAVRLSASFADASGVATNPTTVTFFVGLRSTAPPPDPTATDLGSGTNDATGQYHVDITPSTLSVPGIYDTRVVGTGAVAAAAVGAFRVKPSPFA